MGHTWLWRLSRIWAIVFPHNAYNVAHTLRKKKYGTNVDMISETVWPIFGLGAGATYYPYSALMWAVWPTSCQHIAHTVANIWAPDAFLGVTRSKVRMVERYVRSMRSNSSDTSPQETTRTNWRKAIKDKARRYH